jgi:TM2 domain-containing membrane protein YozV
MAKKAKKSARKTARSAKSSAKATAKQAGDKKVNWVLTLVMSIFFGWLGVDRFIMGQVGMGILKLIVTIITFGIGGAIWWIVDIILIATKYKFVGVEWVE